MDFFNVGMVNTNFLAVTWLEARSIFTLSYVELSIVVTRTVDVDIYLSVVVVMSSMR